MVAPDARGQGVGRTLGVHVVDVARSRRHRAIHHPAQCRRRNARACGLWHGLGCEVIGTVPGAFEPDPAAARPL
ncbi:hypothetical protein E3O19_09810 [Cryobacterium algoritolerans]|uniref:N-acetyltransferase domain-containing protein n=1 Tax=Cryobacterium algoritolerans TaxID=1259184 RepID=A0A4V3IEY5_9MICO|nr:hypothetical protein E3O19_09810 [Cryobacterium algoritolerans]